jgi:hypothetical protein
MAEPRNEARVREILAAYGAEPARWPAGERDNVQAWIAAHGARVADAIADAHALDAALSLLPAPAAPSEDLAARVLAAAPTSRVVPLRARRVGGFGMPAVAALAACAVMGVVVGFSSVGAGDDGLAAEADAAFGAAFALAGGSEG